MTGAAHAAPRRRFDVADLVGAVGLRHLVRPVGTLLAGAVAAYVVGVGALAAAAPVLGWSSSVVVSGSMRPAIDVGDVVLAAPGPPGRLVAGDVIVAETDVGRLTHRLVGPAEGGGWLTKGDANPTPDSDPVPDDRVLGEVVLVVPAVGLPAVWVRAGLDQLVR